MPGWSALMWTRYPLGAFDGSTNLELMRLTKTTDFNKSLGYILQDLMQKRHPIMQNHLLKDLQIVTNAKTGVSIIKHTAQDVGTLEDNNKINAFLDLLKDDTVLGKYNGEDLTVSNLAKDLISYAVLADNQNGATGYRQFIPISYLETVGFSSNVRNFNNRLQEEYMEDVQERFVQQYFQHNPDKIKYKDSSKGKPVVPESGRIPKYALVRLSGSKKQIFKWNNSTKSYEQIPVLGSKNNIDEAGINEYDFNNDVHKSIFQEENQKVIYHEGQKANAQLSDLNFTGQLNKLFSKQEMLTGDVNAIVTIMDRLFVSEAMDKYNPGYREIWNLYKNYLDKDVKIKFEVPQGKSIEGFEGLYRYKENTIYINPNVFTVIFNRFKDNNPNKPVNINELFVEFRRLMMEEVLHSIQVAHLHKGFNTPQGKSIREYYQKALKLGIDNPALQNTGDELVDVAEFIAGIYHDPTLREQLEKADKGFIDRLLNAIKRLMQEMIPGQGFDKVHHDMIGLIKQNFGNVNFLESPVETEQEQTRQLTPAEKLNEIRKNNIIGNERPNITTSYQNYSGGAKGGDTYWDNIGREFGVDNHLHYRPEDYTSLSSIEQNELSQQYMQTVNFLGRGAIDRTKYAGQLVRRDMMQANSADAIFGVTELIAPGVKGRKGYNNKKSYIIPEGGTGYAVARGILSNKPVYVYNQSSNYGVLEGWYKWENGNFVKTEIPILTKKFAGIGSQEINENGIKAIRDVYEKTFNKSNIVDRTSIKGMETYNRKIKPFVTEQSITEKGTFRGKKLVFTEIDSNGKTTSVGARNKGTHIELNIPLLKQKFEDKAWTKPATQKDGSKAQPLPENEFKTFEEFLTFVLIHEIKHDSIKRIENENTGNYETRINNAALEDLKNNYNFKVVEQIDNIKDNPDLYSSKIKPGVEEVFKENPELASIGTQQQYSAYLDTIFPDSKVKDIVYHGTRSQEKFDFFDENKIGELDSGYFGRGFYFSPDLSYADGYSKLYNGYNIAALVNLKNPLETDANQANTNISLINNDGAIVRVGENLTPELNSENYNPNEIGEIVVNTTEQIHILGSKKDIEGFKEFVNNKNSTFRLPEIKNCK